MFQTCKLNSKKWKNSLLAKKKSFIGHATGQKSALMAVGKIMIKGKKKSSSVTKLL